MKAKYSLDLIDVLLLVTNQEHNTFCYYDMVKHELSKNN